MITAAEARQVTNQSLILLDAELLTIIMTSIKYAASNGQDFIKINYGSDKIIYHLRSLGYTVEFGYDTTYEISMTCQRSRIKISW